jgi:RNA polymerase sigma-70 factor (ECF subfamily)
MAKLEQSPNEFLALKEGSEEALDFFIKKYVDVIFRLVDAICDDPPVSEEITVDAFYAVRKNRDSIKDEEHLIRWLKVTAHNKCLSVIRSEGAKRRAELAFLYLNESSTSADLAEFTPDKKEAEKDYVIRRLWSAMKKLSNRQNIIFCMRFIEGKTIEMIAAELEIAKQTVRNHITRARRKLRKELAGLDFR